MQAVPSVRQAQAGPFLPQAVRPAASSASDARSQRDELHPAATAYHHCDRRPTAAAGNADAADPADDYIKELERYPKTELEWLACTLFNRAVDYYLQENDDATRKWADQAFLVAQCIDDGGATRNNLMSRFARLEFGE